MMDTAAYTTAMASLGLVGLVGVLAAVVCKRLIDNMRWV